jgi:hypothetical protein
VPTIIESTSLLLPHRSTAEARRFESSPVPPRRISSSYRGVRTRPTGNFCVDICAASYHLTLRTFKTAHEAARTYNTAAWRLGRPRRDLNFHGVNSAALVTAEERQRQLAITEADERTMAAWRENFPQYVVDENKFYARRNGRSARP